MYNDYAGIQGNLEVSNLPESGEALERPEPAAIPPITKILRVN